MKSTLHRPFRIVAAVLLSFWVSPAAVEAQTAAADRGLELLQRQHRERYAAFASEMQELADFCEAQTFVTAAEQIRRRAQPVEARAFDLDDLPDQVLPPLPASLPDVERQWRTKLLKIEKSYALDLYKLARDALNRTPPHPSFAFQLVREVAFHDPDHQHARRLLGFVRYGDEWTTPFSRLKRTQGFVDHPQFGWISKRHLARYENGERLFNGQWLSVEKEALLRNRFENGWEIETDHFLIRTNHSLEQGVRLGRELETFHRFFIREYAGFFNSPQNMKALFDGGTSPRETRREPHRVHYYRNKEEFVAALRGRQPNISLANGLYLPSEKTAFFFHGDDHELVETMYHEVAHQLLGESHPRTIDVGETADFWVIEGFACYQETFRHDDEGVRIGGLPHLRMFWARHQVEENRFYVPLRQFVRMGKKEFQNPADVQLLHAWYSQATGLVHFFLHYEEGLYRDAFIDYLSQVYSPAARMRNSASLEQLTGVRYETLDEQYHAYLKTLPPEPPAGVEVVEADPEPR